MTTTHELDSPLSAKLFADKIFDGAGQAADQGLPGALVQGRLRQQRLGACDGRTEVAAASLRLGEVMPGAQPALLQRSRGGGHGVQFGEGAEGVPAPAPQSRVPRARGLGRVLQPRRGHLGFEISGVHREGGGAQREAARGGHDRRTGRAPQPGHIAAQGAFCARRRIVAPQPAVP